jgi:adenylate cyclase
MPVEIERKFLLKNDNWRAQAEQSTRIRQGYLGALAKASVRIRVEGDHANINIKSAELSMRRMEYEYSIPLEEANEMLDRLCEHTQIDKLRHIVKYGKHVWEIDEFFGDNAGLVVAEIELGNEIEKFDMPGWAGEDVTEDPRYYNVNLVKHPYKKW